MDAPVQTPRIPSSSTSTTRTVRLNRLTTFFRIFTIIPIAIVLATVSGATQSYSGGAGLGRRPRSSSAAGGLLFAGPLLMILFREKYPRWWFDWNLELTRFSSRVTLYARAAGRPVPVDRRAAVAAPGHRLPGRADTT